MVLLLVFLVALTFPKVQTRLANELTSYVNEKYNTEISIDKIALSRTGQVSIKDVLIRDRQKDTIIYVDRLQTSIVSFKRLVDGNTNLGKVSINRADVIMRTYEGEEDDELQVFSESFKSKKKKKKDLLISSPVVTVNAAKYVYINLNRDSIPIVSYHNIKGRVEDFKIRGSNIYGNIRDLSFIDQNGLIAEKMSTDFTYTKTNMYYKDLHLKTPFSEVNAQITMSYDDGDLSDFLNKVQLDASIIDSSLSLKDARTFYDELGTDDVMHFSSTLSGTLNDFRTPDLDLTSDKGAILMGNIRFVNSFARENGFQVIGDIDHFESDYRHLITLLPNLLGKNLPVSFKKLGHFSLDGNIHLTPQKLEAKLYTNTAIGKYKSDMIIQNYTEINNASYKGYVSVVDFPLGDMINDSLVGKLSLNADIDGKGFNLEKLNTQIKGKVLKHQYKGYNYQNIKINGTIKDKLFAGELDVNDPNLVLNFKGLADLSGEKYKFDFVSRVKHAEFNKLNLSKHDSISILKGYIQVKAIGNRLENMEGFININSGSYTNQKDTYKFRDFSIKSAIKDSIQTITFDSYDIIKGRLKGKFLFAELGKLAQNAAGSVYTHYHPHSVQKNQFLDFNFKIYNQVLSVFLPNIALGDNTSVRGIIDSDKELFKLTFKSPSVTIDEHIAEKIRLQIDNKNPLFNTQLSVKKAKIYTYDITDFDLVNITLNDTLRFNTEFIGGANKKDKYNLSFYHTINQANKSIVGFNKSTLNIKGKEWLLNKDNEALNRVVYDNLTGRIEYQDFSLTHDGQGLFFYGDQIGSGENNYNIDLDRIRIEELIPDIDGFDFKGMLNGGIWIEKRNNMLIPTADIQLIDLSINNILQGDLIGEIRGTNTNKEYSLDLFLEKDETKKLNTTGILEFGTGKPTVDAKISFNNFEIDLLNNIAVGVMENIRGDVSGDIQVIGNIENPDFSGSLYSNEVGLFFPYINVDYAIENNTEITLAKQTFNLTNARIFDSHLNTEGYLSGNISHQFFKKWFLDLHINTENLLGLNTPENDEALFYGTGYLKGTASVTGSTDNVNIAITGTSNPGTEIVIPMSDVKTIETSRLIHYKSSKNKEKISFSEQLKEQFNGVTMDFNLNMTKDATIEFILDQTSGSAIHGNGTGNIQMEIDTKGTFNMFGEYVVDKGYYIFKYLGEIINKKFAVKKGGTISFNGDPLKAELNINAVYKTNANPQTLLTESSPTNNKEIPVELHTIIKGELFDSKQEFDVLIPNAPLELASELDFVLNDQDSNNMMIQFMSLLMQGNFINVENTRLISLQTFAGVGNEAINDFYGMAANAILGLFSNPDDLINLGVAYRQNLVSSTNVDNIYNNNQLEVTAGARLGKNKKISLNGEVFVPTGTQTNNTIAGNASIEFPLNKTESVHAKLFQRRNPIYLDEQDYIRGIGISWQKSFSAVFGKKINYIPKKKTSNTPKDPNDNSTRRKVNKSAIDRKKTK